MLDISKILVVVAYTLLLSIISYTGNNAIYRSNPFVPLLERETVVADQKNHVHPATDMTIAIIENTTVKANFSYQNEINSKKAN